jgi:hypothetical protein
MLLTVRGKNDAQGALDNDGSVRTWPVGIIREGLAPDRPAVLPLTLDRSRPPKLRLQHADAQGMLAGASLVYAVNDSGAVSPLTVSIVPAGGSRTRKAPRPSVSGSASSGQPEKSGGREVEKALRRFVFRQGQRRRGL